MGQSESDLMEKINALLDRFSELKKLEKKALAKNKKGSSELYSEYESDYSDLKSQVRYECIDVFRMLFAYMSNVVSAPSAVVEYHPIGIFYKSFRTAIHNLESTCEIHPNRKLSDKFRATTRLLLDFDVNRKLIRCIQNFLFKSEDIFVYKKNSSEKLHCRVIKVDELGSPLD